MGWTQTGTLNLTNGSKAVVGVGTQFVTQAKIGDGIRGPNGLLYQIDNITGQLAMSIDPAYEGPSVNGAAFMLVPIQGYVKESADRLRVATDTFRDYPLQLGNKQDKNANLTAMSGLTGAADRIPYFTGVGALSLAAFTAKARELVSQTTTAGMRTTLFDAALPVEFGGTGGTNQQTAQTGLGLVPVSGPSDLDGTRLLRPGWQGFGGPQRLIPNTDFNALPTLSFDFIGQTTTNGPEAGDFYISNKFYDGNNSLVRAVSISSGKEYFRVKIGVWGPWSMVTTTSNAAGAIASGAIIEKGSNASGEYTRYVDGTLICVLPINSRTVDISAVNGSGGFNSLVQGRAAYPYPFISTPFQDISVTSLTDSAIWYGSGDTGTPTEFKRYYLFGFTAGARSIETRGLAIGRWKA